ncbi:MAG TPA: hypothetical protein VGA37_07045 [Gemmatimonadales bacterium]
MSAVHQLEGYGGPEPIHVVMMQYRRRIVSDMRAVGASLGGSVASVDWTLFVRRERHDQTQSSRAEEDPPVDTWRARATTVGGGAQRSLFHGAAILTIRGTWTGLRGDARRADLAGVIFAASEHVLRGWGEVRFGRATSPWQAASRFTLTRESWVRRDFVFERSAEIDSWLPGGGIEVARAFKSGTAVSLAVAMALYAAISRIPDPVGLEPAYQILIAPELSLYATRVAPRSTTITVRQDVGRSRWVFASSRYESVGTDDEPLPFRPDGRRTKWQLTFGVVLGPG